jgi:hypothetical protein
MTISIVDLLLRVVVWTRLSHGSLAGAFGVYGTQIRRGEETGQMVGVVDMTAGNLHAWLQMDNIL